MAQKPTSTDTAANEASAESHETNNALTTTGNGGALAAVPEWMQEDARLGKENISAEDIIIPRVQLAAAISAPVIDGLVAAGNFFHTVLEEDMGSALDITIIHHSKRWTLWKPRHQGGGILARASDGRNWDRGDETFADIQPDKARPRYKVEWRTGKVVGKDIGLGAWGTSDPDNEDSQPAATLTHVLLCTSPQIPGVFAILLQRTGEKVAKGLLSKIDLDKAPIFGQRYRMTSKVDTRGSDEYHQYVFTKAGYVSQEEYVEFKKMNERFNEMQPKVDDAIDPDAEGDRDNSGGGDDGGTGNSTGGAEY